MLLSGTATTKFQTTQSECSIIITTGLQLQNHDKIQSQGGNQHNILQPTWCFLTISSTIQNKFNAEDMSYLFGN
jgi:hypothetical protein